MKLKLIRQELLNNYPNTVFEFRNKDGARIDAVINDLAIEFENSYKWINQRILYNLVKAHRSGFNKLLIVYPFNSKTVKNSWVSVYAVELGVELFYCSHLELNDFLNDFFFLKREND